jgi:hypothetical protein
MKTTTLFVLAFFVAFSCTDESITIKNNEKNDLIVFKDASDYWKTYDELSKANSTAYCESWASIRNHSTLLNSTDPGLQNFPDATRTIFNEDYEYQIGDEIIWLNKGNLYSFNKEQAPNRSKLKLDPSQCKKVGAITSIKIGGTNVENGRTSASIPLQGLDARNQKEFNQVTYQPCGSTSRALAGIRKYVHEVFDHSAPVDPRVPNSGTRSTLYLRIKLEYKGSSWRPAGEQRQTTVNVNCTYVVTNSGAFPQTSTISTSNNCYSGDWTIRIGESVYGPILLGPPSWDLTMTGSIEHNVKGDAAANKWTNTEWKAGYGVLW